MEVSRFLKLTYLVTNFVKSSLVAQMVKNLPVTWETPEGLSRAFPG